MENCLQVMLLLLLLALGSILNLQVSSNEKGKMIKNWIALFPCFVKTHYRALSV